MEALADIMLGEEEPAPAAAVTLVDFDPDAERKLVAAMLWPYSDLPEEQVLAAVGRMTPEDREAVVEAYVGDRRNRRHKPGRALERVAYRFDVLSDYGAFRDLQRHRMLTIEWQRLGPEHGWDLPAAVAEAGYGDQYAAAMERSRALHDALADEGFREQASYAVCLAFKVRYSVTMNAREAMHMIELRTGPQGHPSYRRVCQDMHHLIEQEAGHSAVAAMMRFVDHEDIEASGLERLEAERRAEARRAGL
jgi:hypothetical protein